MIHVDEVLMNREKEFPLDGKLLQNLAVLMAAINYIRGVYGKPLMLSSGYRPDYYNTQAGGAKNSSHLTCEAVDILDSSGEFSKWCQNNLSELARAGLYMEDPEKTIGWVHLQTRRPPSGNRIFKIRPKK